MKRFVVIAALVAAPDAAHAYRPFDGTDADVAETGDIELEIGPAQASRDHGATTYEPGFVFNQGIAPGYELVVDIDGEHPIGTAPGATLVTSDVLVKHVIRAGNLQDGHGPSVAIETGVLLPVVPARSVDEAGWSFALITSEKWEHATVHVNVEAVYERDRDLAELASVIVEGPSRWPVRPVTELLVDRDDDRGRLESALGGAIWRVRDNLAIDAAVRAQRASDTTIFEIRAGVTWAFPI